MLPPIARRFVAGESPIDALQHVREMNERGVGVILNLLGEHYADPERVAADAAAYRGLIDDVADANLRARVSVKPSQLGLDVSEDLFRETLAEVVARGRDRGVFVWIDMEDHTTTDATIDAYETLAHDFGGGERTDGSRSSSDRRSDGGVGICLQANLRRTPADAARLADVPGAVRFVKGAYDPPADVAYQDRSQATDALCDLLTEAVTTFEAADVAVGTHDPAVIDHALALEADHGADVEMQLLMGIREDVQTDLAARGHDVWQYAPYGRRWKSYFYRRVRERKENLLLAARAVLGV